ncbi:MAG: MprA protease, GlyGly-CTERM protein-sorting domain-containing form [Desulfobacteraceae bacterium]|nr:MAG: MprA protease, GlyGly-CTERM protein-sorting domain-containing form [Desulfobacteraceae bacterium]
MAAPWTGAALLMAGVVGSARPWTGLADQP